MKAADIPLEKLAANPNVPKAEKLDAACRAFEAVLLRQILDSAQKPVIASTFSNESTAASVYRDMVTTQMADDIAKSGQFGLARSFLDQLKDKAKKGAGPANAASTPPPSTTAPAASPAHGSEALRQGFRIQDARK